MFVSVSTACAYETSGFPKAIWYTNAGFALGQVGKVYRKKIFPRLSFDDLQQNRVGISAYPPKWGAGLGYMTLVPIQSNHLTVVLPPDTIGLPPDLFKKVMHWNPDVEGLHGPPQPIEGLWKDITTRPLLKNLEFM